MKNLMMILALGLIATGCASTPRMNRWETPEMRIMVIGDGYLDPLSIDEVQGALIESNRYHVVDRNTAMKAIMAEQEMTNDTQAARFDDQEKFAQIGKLLGVGGVVRAGKSCGWKIGTFGGQYEECKLTITMFSTSTGQAIASKTTKANRQDIDWSVAAAEFNNALPDRVLKQEWSDDMIAHKAQLAKDAQARKAASVKVSE